MFVPANVLLEIAAYVEHTDRMSMSLVNFTWADALIPKVQSRLVYLVRHRRHSLSLKQHLDKCSHLIRELTIGDSYTSVNDHTWADYLALRGWLMTSCRQITRLRVVYSSEPNNVIALLGCIAAIPFNNDEHRNSTLSKCTESIAKMLLVCGDEPISGWKYSFLSLENPGKFDYQNRLHWELTSDWIERVSIVGAYVPHHIRRTWSKLQLMHQHVLDDSFSIWHWLIKEPLDLECFPQLRRIAQVKYGFPEPTGLENLPSNCVKASKEACLGKREGLEYVFHFVGLKTRPLSIFEEICQYPIVSLCKETYKITEIKAMTLTSSYLERDFEHFYDVYTLEQPYLPLEYLQIIATMPIGRNILSPYIPERFFTVSRLKAIPDRFPNLQFILLENLPLVDDEVLREMLFEAGNPIPRLRKLRHITVNKCAITQKSTYLLNLINTGRWLHSRFF